MLTELSLRNFKSFTTASIPLAPFTIVLGANGAGKSNFFDALRFLRAIGEGRSVRDAIEGHALPGGGNAVSYAGVRGGGAAVTHFLSNSQRFALTAKIRTSRGTLITYFVEVNASTYRVVHEELKSSGHSGPYVYSTRPETGALDQSEDSPIVTARFHKASRGLNPRRDFSPHEFILSQFVSRRAESRANEEVAEIARMEFASITPLELRPETLRQYSPRGHLEMGEHGENFAAAVAALVERARRGKVQPVVTETGARVVRRGPDESAAASLEALRAWIAEVTPRPIVDVLTQSTPTGEVIFAVKEAPFSKPIAAPSLSDGTLRFAALALAAVGSDDKRTLVVEEIENGINPSRVAALIRMLEQAAGNLDVQVIASTHSPAVLDYATESSLASAVVVGWNEESQSSHPVRLRDLPGFAEVRKKYSLGELQLEGWLQAAASV